MLAEGLVVMMASSRDPEDVTDNFSHEAGWRRDH
jgi:hypothetical protein